MAFLVWNSTMLTARLAGRVTRWRSGATQGRNARNAKLEQYNIEDLVYTNSTNKGLQRSARSAVLACVESSARTR